MVKKIWDGYFGLLVSELKKLLEDALALEKKPQTNPKYLYNCIFKL